MKKIEIRKGYVYLYYDEMNDVNVLISLLKEVAEICKRENIKKILSDLSNMQGEPNFMDRFRLGVAAAWHLRGINKSAIVYRNVDTNRFAETVAVNRGLPTLITHDLEEAKRWLEVE